MDKFADAVADMCLKKYSSLKKTGKPTVNEWTILAGIVLEKSDKSLSIISLATGTKCLGAKQLTNCKVEERGVRLHDSHAEILSRRAFLRWLYYQADITFANTQSEIFTINEGKKVELKDGTRFHFYCSQTPCGDCSIFPMENSKDDGPPEKMRKLLSNEDNSEYNDTHRTGAKCVSKTKQDLHLPGIDYHVVGSIRTKPGRGDPTMSLSCSDKIAKWCALGVQGSLLSIFLPKITFKTIIIGGKYFSAQAAARGIYKRFNLGEQQILYSSVPFLQEKSSERTNPCPSSVIWCSVPSCELEVSVEGRKQGATKRKGSVCLSVCREALLRDFLTLCKKYPLYVKEHSVDSTYYSFKKLAKEYQDSWERLKKSSFQAWPAKPIDLLDFNVI